MTGPWPRVSLEGFRLAGSESRCPRSRFTDEAEHRQRRTEIALVELV